MRDRSHVGTQLRFFQLFAMVAMVQNHCKFLISVASCNSWVCQAFLEQLAMYTFQSLACHTLINSSSLGGYSLTQCERRRNGQLYSMRNRLPEQRNST